MNIDQLLEMWTEDAKIDESKLNEELARISNLHAKYIKIRTHNNLLVKKHQIEYSTRRKIKQDYFSGDLNNPEDLERYQLEPLQKKVYKQSMNAALDSDEELNKILIKKIIYEEMVDTCDSILKEINNRTYQLGNLVKWQIYLNGNNI
jgi:hypothetical protein